MKKLKREIKFRVWFASKKKYSCFVNNSVGDAVSFGLEPCGHLTAIDRFGDEILINEADTIIEQFTGLTDKNSKEIYEGDIVTTRPSAGCLTSVLSPEEFTSYTKGEVVFSAGSWRIQQSYLGAVRLYEFTNCECCPAYSIEIIGNIHENPELLN